jgi:hypothetical protein
MLVTFNMLKHCQNIIWYARFNIKIFYILPTQSFYMFRMDLRTNSEFCPTQNELTDR